MTERFFLNELGLVCAIGDSRFAVGRRLFAGDGGVETTERYSPGRSLPAGTVDSTLPALDAWPVELRSRNNQLVLAAAEQLRAAVDAASARFGAHRVAVVVGTSTSGIGESEGAIRAWIASGRMPAGYAFAQQELSSPAAFLAHVLGVRGPAYVHSSACASSAKAMAAAARLLRIGAADAVVTGGADSLCAFTVAGFASLNLLSDRRCNPLSVNRDGINIGEAAALFLMTREPATVSLRGWGESSDGHHFSAPDPTGNGARIAITRALTGAGITAGDVGYINLHGTATPANDAMESAVVHELFGDRVPVSATKPLTGHTLGAAGALEAAFCWLTMQDENVRGSLPPHIWDGERDPALPALWPVAHGESLGRPPRFALSNSFAFGGANAALVFGRD
ncbi:MAG: beta-ketoacyl-ACP synthase [Gemmatimonadaceae bacterium]